MTSKMLWPLILVSTLLSGCGSGAESESEATATAQVRVTVAKLAAMSRHLEGYGAVGFAPELLHTVSAAADVRVERVLVSAGESVAMGQALLVVRPTATTSLDTEKALNDARFASQELSRLESLRQQQLATNAEVAVARQANANAIATLASLRQRNGPSDGQVKADRAGLVASVEVQQGDVVAAGAPLLHLADRAQLRLRLGIEPAALSQLHEGQAVAIVAVYDAAVKANGHVVKVVRQIDPQTRLGEALVDVDAAGGLLPGATVKAAIEIAQRVQVLSVPRQAVLYAGGRSYAYVVRAGKASQVWVKTGQDDGRNIEIVDGIKPGDEVVVEGNYELEDGMAVKIAAPSP